MTCVDSGGACVRAGVGHACEMQDVGSQQCKLAAMMIHLDAVPQRRSTPDPARAAGDGLGGVCGSKADIRDEADLATGCTLSESYLLQDESIQLNESHCRTAPATIGPDGKGRRREDSVGSNNAFSGSINK